MFFKKVNFKFRLASVVLALVILFVSVPVPIHAASKKDTYYKISAGKTYSTINVPKATLNKASDKTVVKTKNFSYSAKISNSYDMHIYHFEAPSSGYYSFHTTGSLDTVIRVYEEQNVLFWTSRYKDRGLSDDGSMADGNYFNANLVVKLDSGEDYYICVRGYNNKIGSYTLYAESNQDKMLTSAYGYNTWKSKDGSPRRIGDCVCGVQGKQYLSKTDVIFFAWSLDPFTQELVGKDVNYVYTAYKKGYSYAVQAVNFVMSLLPLDYGPGVAMNLLGVMLDYAIGAAEVEPYEMMKKLKSLCGVRYDGKKWICQNGLLIEEYFHSSMFPATRYYFYANNDSVRKGVSGAKGIWSK